MAERGIVKRSKILNYRTGQYVELSLNPTKIKKSKGIEIGEDGTPGFYDPLLKGLGGKGDTVSFSIYVHAMAHLERFGVQIINEAQNDFIQEAEGFDISGQLEFYEAFAHPSDPDKPGGTGSQDYLVYVSGRYFRAAKYLMSACDIEIQEQNGELAPTVAEVSLTLRRVVEENRFSNDIYRFSGA